MVPTIPLRRRRRWPWILLLLVVVGAAGVGVGTLRGGGSGGEGKIKSDDLDLRLGKSDVRDIQVTVNEVGTIEPVVKVDVKSNLSGKVIDLLVLEGDKVRAGQVLARVEPDVNQAQTLAAVRSEFKLAQIRAADAKRDVETNERLYHEGYLSDTDMKNFRLKLDTSTEDLEAAKTRNRIVEESGIPLTGQISTTERVNIVSPMEGYVIKKNVEVGQTVTSGVSSFNEGTVIYTVADLQSMLIKASINEVDIGRVRLNMPVVVTVDAFPYRRFDGTVTHISPAARLKDKVKVFDIEVTLKAQVPDFRAGMTANIEVRGDKALKVLAVPAEAVFKKNDREIVYVLKKTFDEPKPGERNPRKTKAGKYDISDAWQRFFEEREVKVGLASLERAQLLKGLEAGVDVALEDPTKPRQVEED
ncbi:MAG: efflux RND transporter periplasmic adaptor subunit [Acidobacteriia bacterium]|nr:efflux RND transporter periplasmic adaptor subunit [Terriglobia bacterium]